MIRLFFDTGMRMGEMCGILLADLDMRADQVTVTAKVIDCGFCLSVAGPEHRSSAICGCA
jgi:hypothetical protein